MAESELAMWEKKIKAVLGDNAHFMTKLIPELEMIIGKQRRPHYLTPREEKSKFEQTFKQFVQCFGEERKPLLLFLDDIQWMDHSTWELLDKIFKSEYQSYVFPVFSYRSDVDNCHWSIESFKEKFLELGFQIDILELGPLRSEFLRDWLADTFKMFDSNVLAFAKIIVSKTGGNPYFIKQFVEKLYSAEAIYFDREGWVWRWDEKKAIEQTITENTIGVLVESFRSLPPEVLNVLCHAACLGETFSLDEFLIVGEGDESVLKEGLLRLHELEMIIPLQERSLHFLKFEDEFITNAQFKFVHSKLREAAEFLLSPKKRARIHISIGKAQLRFCSPAQLEDRIYEVCEHFNPHLEFF